MRVSIRRIFWAAALAALFVETWTACGKKQAETAGSPPDPAKGRIVYAVNCIACHNPDPSKDGSLGPSVQGSSLELLQARILRNEYPPGYAPKRDTKLMVKLPLSEADVASLHAYLSGP